MKVHIETIPHSQQRYPTVGDWWLDYSKETTEHTYESTVLQIRVSDLGDVFKETCIAVHEYIEAMLCLQRGVIPEQVDRFDKEFEENRESGNTDEPGDHPRAPYKKEHCFATGIERLLVSEFDIDWKIYEEIINSL